MLRVLCFLIVIGFVFSYSCRPDHKIDRNIHQTIKYQKTQKLSITGDFDGDGKTDTLYQNIINTKTNFAIDSFPECEWDSTQLLFDKLNAELIITSSNPLHDTLHLGKAFGLYCLINIGKNNDVINKDKIALVIDHFDFTSINSCFIYTLYNNSWVKVKAFRIHEDAFIYETDSMPVFTEIRNYLEHRKTGWFYIDYYDKFNAESSKDTFLKPFLVYDHAY